MKRVFGVILWLAMLAICLIGLERFFRRTDGREKYSAFFEETQSIDVFFLGTSHVMDAVYPMELWRDYGVTSYNLGNPSETPEATYWTLRLALETHRPKLVMMDVCYIDRAQSELGNYALSHVFLDEVPLSPLKLEAIWAMFPEGERAAYVWPLYYSHGRWEEMLLGGAETTACVPAMRGAELRVGRSAPAPFTRTTEMNMQETEGKRAIRRIIDLCRSEGISIALMAIPYPADEEKQRMMNSAQRIADEYGIALYNLFDVQGLVDFDTDCYDEMSHLNPDGAIKVSAWLGARITDDYALEDHRQDAAYAHWNDALDEYDRMVDEQWSAQSLAFKP